MKRLSKKLQDVLFGKSNIEAGLPVRATLNYPSLDGSTKTIYWEGNRGIIIPIYEKIEGLEKEVEELKKKK